MQEKNYKLILAALIVLSLAFLACVPAQAQDKDQASAATTEETEATVPTQTSTVLAPSLAAQKIEEVKKEVSVAKVEAEAALAEAERAQKEAELHKQAADIEKQKLETEIKETEVSKKEAELAKKEASNKGEVRKAVEKAKQEEKEDKIAKEKAAITEEKMMAAQEKANLAAAELKVAQTKLAIAMEKIKAREANKTFAGKLSDSLVIILIGLALFLAMKIGTRKLTHAITEKDAIRESETTLEIKTIVKLINWLGTVVIFVIIVYLVLEKHGFNVAPLIAGAGIVGLAFGFGGQYLIRDLINGLFILIEGQYRINDVVKIGEYGGLVEDINLRITTLRDLEGRVIIIPNGEIKTVVNYTREYAHALLDVGVAYKENVDKVIEVIRSVGKEMMADSYFGKLILDDMEMFGVDAFSDSAVIIKFRLKTLPIKQWEVMREFRRRLKNRFDELGIEIPFPHRTLYMGTGKDNDPVQNFLKKA